ncbi:aspartate 1-decarboxylase [Aggregatilinea lenta]|uniref:aspartate 1-decarboxylase n=1 Tax=Aggregatilinea lenta TaxID=913108 RepID=UPI000E5B2D85|nr:aspartate 1-decarboxylase [Aggregatilinea lenta]
MQVSMLRAKLHHARVTDANIEYVGSITIDTDLLAQVKMIPYEQVLVVDVENGARFETYIIPGAAGSGVIQVNGAAAHLVNLGDRLIVMAFGLVEFPPIADWQPHVVVLDKRNAVLSIESEGRYT